MDVPLIVLMELSLPTPQSDVMFSPGAKMSMHVPTFENEARASVMVVAPTVIASKTSAGDWRQADMLLLPAAIAYVTPLVIEFRTAASRPVEMLPPRLMLATAGETCIAVTPPT